MNDRKNLIKRAAKAVRKGVIAGILPPIKTQQCELCNSQAKEYHHHLGYGYGELLEVIPLCRICHREVHCTFNVWRDPLQLLA